MSSSYRGKALDILKALPRVQQCNLKNNPGATQRTKRHRGIYGGKTHGCGKKDRQRPMPAGFEPFITPFYLRFPQQNWKNDKHSRLSYKPFNLQNLQQLVDLGRIRTDIPVDITQLYNSGKFKLFPDEGEGGLMLDEDGADCFVAKLNLEVQWISNEAVIAAIERAGGVITAAYYDPISLLAAMRPFEFFKKGHAIPRRMLPPQNLIDYYSDPKNRGYLADPEEVAKERLLLAQKFGYELPEILKDDKCLLEAKDPRQIYYGLEPGWVVDVINNTIIKPTDPVLKEYYAS